MTTVVKVTKANREAFLADPLFVWVGRATPRLGMPASPFGNPWKAGAVHDRYCVNREQAVSLYASALASNEDEKWTQIRRLLPLLKGKKLGCCCLDWEGVGEPADRCHAIELAKAADQT